MMTTRETIRTYILENFLFSNDQSLLGDEDSLLDKGIIDSTGVMELVMFLEQTFAIRVQDEEMVPENLDSIALLATFVAGKRANLNVA